MDARAITKALGGKWAGRYGLARCPVHADSTPSLKISDCDHRGVDVHCFAGCDWKDIKNELRRQGLLNDNFSADIQERSKVIPAPAEDEHKNIAPALSLWRGATPLPGTLGETYFTEHRGMKIDGLNLEHALRYHRVHRMVVALMTDAITNEPCGIHRTFLEPDGIKIERKMLGRQGVVRISPDEDVTHGLGIAEGVEDALGILISGWAPVWAATSAGAIERFPVLSGIEHLTIFADDDTPGIKAARACADQWITAGREALATSLRD
jgi:putative DNA primase/helicase